MRIALEWLCEFVDLDVPVEALAERLPGIGLGVEAVERSGEDTVLDLEVTSNRPDWMSLIGVAREVALLFGRPLRSPGGGATRGSRRPPRGAPSSSAAGPHSTAAERAAVRIDDPAGCPRFTASVIAGVRVGPSPAWMQRRLEASGVRAINNVVDVTNYVMLELGQPMHAFDLSRVAGHRLIVRRARPGETLETLDGVTRPLDGEILVVADEERAISLAGIIGGSSTEIGPGTTTVLLEAAYWHPPGIGRTARRLGVRTEASARFERGADPEGPPRAQARAAALLAAVCGGHVQGGLVDIYPRRVAPPVIRLRPERLVAVLGVEVRRNEMIRILRALGCAVDGTQTLKVRAPTFRPDLAREEDLIEEVIRIYGYDRVPLTLPRGATTPGVVAPALRADRHVRETLSRCGLVEVLTLTLVTPEAAASGGATPVMLQNPLVRDHAALRTSLLPGLLEVLVTNASRRIGDVHVFELGRVFRRRERMERPEERRTLGIAVMGRWRHGWNVPEAQAVADLFHLKGILDTLLSDLSLPSWQVAPIPNAACVETSYSWWHPGRAAEVTVSGRAVARFGELHPDRAAAERLPHPAYLAEIDLEALYGREPIIPGGVYAGLPRHPEIERDLAAVVPEAVPAAQAEGIIREAAGPLLEAVELFDVYTGAPVPAGHRNLAYRLRLRAPDRTLTAAEAEEIMGRVRIALRTRASAQLRE